MTQPMPELANHYLGNVTTDGALEQQVHQALHGHSCLEVALDHADRKKGRILAQARSGESIGIAKDRSWSLREGDVFQTEAGTLLLVHLKAQGMIVLSLSEIAAGNALALVHLGHTLGNHHYPISIERDRIYIPVTGDRAVIESTVNSFKIPGLVMAYEERSPSTMTFHSHDHAHSAASSQPSQKSSLTPSHRHD